MPVRHYVIIVRFICNEICRLSQHGNIILDAERQVCNFEVDCTNSHYFSRLEKILWQYS